MSISASPATLHPKFESFLNERRFVVSGYRQSTVTAASLSTMPQPGRLLY